MILKRLMPKVIGQSLLANKVTFNDEDEGDFNQRGHGD
jgi:hypothetical protein